MYPLSGPRSITDLAIARSVICCYDIFWPQRNLVTGGFEVLENKNNECVLDNNKYIF